MYVLRLARAGDMTRTGQKSQVRARATMVHAALFISPNSSCETARTVYLCVIECVLVFMSYHHIF